MEAAGSLAHAWKQQVAGPLEWQRTGPQAGAASPPSFRHSKVVEWSDRVSSSTLPGTCMLGDLDSAERILYALKAPIAEW